MLHCHSSRMQGRTDEHDAHTGFQVVVAGVQVRLQHALVDEQRPHRLADQYVHLLVYRPGSAQWHMPCYETDLNGLAMTCAHEVDACHNAG